MNWYNSAKVWFNITTQTAVAWISFFWLFHFFVIGCDELSEPPPLPGLNVQHIPCCTSQYDFNLFSQAGSTDPILFGISVSFHCDTLDVSLCVWDGRGRRPCFLACVCVCARGPGACTLVKETSWYLSGASHRSSRPWSQLRKQSLPKCQGRRRWCATELRSASAGARGRLRRAESKCRIKHRKTHHDHFGGEKRRRKKETYERETSCGSAATWWQGGGGVGGEDGITSPQTGLERCKRGTGSEWQRPITYS